jgi:hypothetical protein
LGASSICGSPARTCDDNAETARHASEGIGHVKCARLTASRDKSNTALPRNRIKDWQIMNGCETENRCDPDVCKVSRYNVTDDLFAGRELGSLGYDGIN